KILAEMLVNTNKVALLAVSDFSRDFFQSYGFTANRIYDFGYFRNSVHVSPSPKSSIKEILFVGQLVGRKQVDLVLAALVPRLDTALAVAAVGDGEEEGNSALLAHELGVSEVVRFIGVIPSDRIMQRIKQAHVFVLASRYDGWGLV